MARADHIVDLVASGIRKDTDRVHKVAQAIAPDARAKNHVQVAERIALDLVRHYHLTRGNISFEDLVNLRLDLRAKMRRDRAGIPLRFNH